MDIEELRDYILHFEEVQENQPFGPDVAVYKTNGKIFALLPLNSPNLQLNLKCNPERAVELREQYPENVFPGYHMSKVHWNTVVITDYFPNHLLRELIQHSYQLIHNSNKKKK